MPMISKMYKKVNYVTTVCNFQSMKSPVELNSLLFMSLNLIRDKTGGLTNEANFSNPIVSFEIIA